MSNATTHRKPYMYNTVNQYWQSWILGAIQIICDTFLDNFRSPPPLVSFGDITPLPPGVWCDILIDQNTSIKSILRQKRQKRSIFFEKMLCDTSADPLPPPCDIWWQCPVPPSPSTASCIIWMVPSMVWSFWFGNLQEGTHIRNEIYDPQLLRPRFWNGCLYFLLAIHQKVLLQNIIEKRGSKQVFLNRWIAKT
jgi:hypothetical protein